MTTNNTLDLDIIQRLHNLVEQNTSPENIQQTLYTEFAKELSGRDITDYIRKYLDKEWSAYTKQSKQSSNQTTGQMTLLEEGMYIDIIENDALATETSKSVSNDNKDEKSDNKNLKDSTKKNKTNNLVYKDKPIETSIPSTDSNCENMFDALEVMDYLKAFHKTLMLLDESNRNLSNKIARLESKITEMQCNNPYEKVQKFADDLIEIYANEKSKKSVNINPLINDRIIEAMHKKYNISNNNALAINTALLLALYKSGIDTLSDKK